MEWLTLRAKGVFMCDYDNCRQLVEYLNEHGLSYKAESIRGSFSFQFASGMVLYTWKGTMLFVADRVYKNVAFCLIINSCIVFVDASFNQILRVCL